VILVGVASAFLMRQPDILVSEDGNLIAVRDGSGGYAMSSLTRGSFEREIWLRRAGTEAAAAWPLEGYSPDGRLSCDSLGCLYRLNGRLIALALEPGALAEDCRAADVVISVDSIRIDCPARLARIDWRSRRGNGAYALWIAGDGTVDILAVDDLRGDRPWVRKPP
jgi:competence protein ComEC